MADMVLIPGAPCAYALEIASEDDVVIADAAGGATEDGELLKALSGLYVAMEQCSDTRRGRLTRFIGTDLVQWIIPRHDGTAVEEGAIMKIVEVKPRN